MAARPDISLIGIKELAKTGASVRIPLSVTETPRASPFSSSARELIFQTTGRGYALEKPLTPGKRGK